MFRNRHVVLALLLAPVLSLMAWVAVGNLLGGQGAPAQPGTAYPLLEKSSCRYPSGICELSNADINLALQLDESGARALQLSASHPLEAALLSVAGPGASPGPRAMRAEDAQRLRWRLQLPERPPPGERIRLVVAIAGSTYFAETSTAFLQPGGAQP